MNEEFKLCCSSSSYDEHRSKSTSEIAMEESDENDDRLVEPYQYEPFLSNHGEHPNNKEHHLDNNEYRKYSRNSWTISAFQI